MSNIEGSIRIKYSGTVAEVKLSECTIYADNVGTEIFIKDDYYDEYLLFNGFFYMLISITRNDSDPKIYLYDLRNEPRMFDNDTYLATGFKGLYNAKSYFEVLPNKRKPIPDQEQ